MLQLSYVLPFSTWCTHDRKRKIAVLQWTYVCELPNESVASCTWSLGLSQEASHALNWMGRLTKDTQLRQIGWILRSTTLSIGWVHDPHYCTNTSVETITSIFLLKKNRTSYLQLIIPNSTRLHSIQATAANGKIASIYPPLSNYFSKRHNSTIAAASL